MATVLYEPKSIAESIKDMPLMWMAVANVVLFVGMTILASGIGIRRSFTQVLERLGLTRITWKQVGQLLVFALFFSLAMQFLEQALMPFVPENIRQALELISAAMEVHGSFWAVLGQGLIIGISAGLGEEILFRGLLQPVFGLIPTTLLFAMFHFHYGFTIVLVQLFIVGLVLGIVRKRINTTAAIVLHSGFDFFAVMYSFYHH